MKSSLELTIVENEISAPGVRFTPTGLRWEGEPSEKTISTVASVIHTVRSVIDWAEADYLPQMVRIQLGRSARKQKRDADAEQLEMRVLTEYAELNSQNPAQLHLRDKVGRFFPESLRRPELSFTHHAEAWAGAGGDTGKAVAWLDEAATRKLSVSGLRLLIRSQCKAEAAGDEPHHVMDKIEHELANIDLVAARLRAKVSGLTPSQALDELRAMTNVVALVHDLERVVDGQPSAT